MDAEALARKLESLRPRAVAYWRHARPGAPPDLQALLDAQLRGLARRVLGDYEHQMLLSLPPERLARGRFHLGTIHYAGKRYPLGLQAGELLQNMAVFGRSGAGKTNLVFHLLGQLVEQGIPWLFLDWKRTVRHLLPHLHARVRVYTPGRLVSPFPFNPFQPPPGLEAEAYWHQVLDVLADAYTLGDAATSIIEKALRASAAEFDHAPTVGQLRAAVDRIPDMERVRGWKATALRALESLEATLQSVGDAHEQARTMGTVTWQSTVLELDGLSTSGKQVVVPLVALWVYYAKLATKQREELSLVIVVEEAHHVLYTRTGRETILEMLLRQCRELGIAIVVVDQHPSLISPAALGNCYTSIILNLKDPTDARKAAQLSAVPDETTFTRLPVGQAVVKLQNRWHHPILISIPHVPHEKGHVTDTDLERRGIGFGAGSGAVGSGSEESGQVRQGPSGEGALGEEALRLVKDVLEHPWDGVKARYARLGLSAHRGTRLVRELVRTRWLDTATIPVGSSRKVVLRPTRKAAAALATTAPTRESIEHAYWKNHYAEAYRRAGWKVTVEAPIPGGRVDVLAQKHGKRVAIQIEAGRSDVVGNVRRCLRANLPHVVVIATTDAAFEEAVAVLGEARLLVQERVILARRDAHRAGNGMHTSWHSAGEPGARGGRRAHAS